jgi:hypothetical protein
LKQKAVTMAILVLLSTALLFMPLSIISGQESVNVYIYQVTQQGSYTAITDGTVGLPVNLVATIATQNGPYQVYFGDTLVDNSTSSGYYVSSNFTIPELLGGDYNITLKDVTEYVYTDTSFTVNSEYSVKAIVPQSPALLQEGNNVVLNVTVTGGQPNTAYAANVTVMMPSPLATNYTTTMISFTSSSLGTAQAQVTFPGSSFQPSGSTTIYTGLYTAFFNMTEGLGQNQFLIGLTDTSQYHKQDTVKIRAIDYQPSQTATLTIQGQAGTILSKAVTASDQGVITTEWTIPSTATVGQYNVTITPQTNPKAIPDSQIFTIPGYPITINTLNLAGDFAPYLTIEAIDQASNTITNETSGYYGSAQLNLEKGNHTINAYWAEERVGEITVSITGEATYNITCQLTNLIIVVQDKNGIAIPFVDVSLKYQYVTTTTGTTQTGNASGQTDITGAYAFNSTLPGINYDVDASKYGVVFNAGNNTINNLPAQPSTQVIVLCPDKTLTLTAVDYNLAALTNARIELVEQSSGIFYSASTGSTGTVPVQVTLGQYRLRIYTADNTLLNETVINVLSNTQSQVRCVLYNLQVSIKIVDYFGNPISNVNIQLSRSGMNTRSATTQGDGTVTFDNVIGGNIQITAYPSGNEGAFAAENLYLDSPTTVQIKMASFVALGSLLIGTTLLATLLIVVIAVVVFLGFEVYKKTGFKLIRKKGN